MHIIYMCFMKIVLFSFELHKNLIRFIIINGIKCAVGFTFKTVPSGKNHMVRMEETKMKRPDFINGIKAFISLFKLNNEAKDEKTQVRKASEAKHNETFGLDKNVRTLKDLRVALIADSFTSRAFSYECKIEELTSSEWKEQITSFNPHMLFIESAWKGKDSSWFRKVDRYSPEMNELCIYCRKNKIPIVFWNKEDPVYTDSFMITASYADYVFTTDTDCISEYKTRLNHGRVYHLHFAAQPAVHNPIEKYERKPKFCFAGAYYHKYESRSRVFDSFADVFDFEGGFDIFDRNYKSALPEHRFPKKYDNNIVGSLSPDEIDRAYKGYMCGVNMNSISKSQSMFARRVFEMLASNTVTVGNYSRGLANYFGDLTISTDCADTMVSNLKKYAGSPEIYRKYRLSGLRAVLKEHLYEDRLSYVCQKVFSCPLKKENVPVTVCSIVKDADEAGRVIKMFENQSYENKRLVFIRSDSEFKAPDGGFTAFFCAGDYYGENYLLDLMLTLRYYPANGVSKGSFYSCEGGAVRLKNVHPAYTPVKCITLRRSVVKSELLFGADINADSEIECGGLFSADEFNYCENFLLDKCCECDDLFIPDKGIEFKKIIEYSQSIKPAQKDPDALDFELNEFASSALKTGNVRLSSEGKNLVIISTLKENTHDYIYIKKSRFEPVKYMSDGVLPVFFGGSGELDLICVTICYDSYGNKIGALFPHLNRYEKLALPEGTKYCEIGFRPKGPGRARLSRITVGGKNTGLGEITLFPRSDSLVICRGYPSYDDIYKYMFVHTRVKGMKKSGIIFDVAVINDVREISYREYDGINVCTANAEGLRSLVKSGVKRIFVHFLDSYIWSALKPLLPYVDAYIFAHGADIQPWYRRSYNYVTEDEIRQAKIKFEKNEKIWREVYAESSERNIMFIFVSEYLKRTVSEDYGFEFDEKNSRVIHNCIDTDLFSYEKKSAGQRFNILSVKSFANKNYANDISAKAIAELSKYPEFKRMTFDIYGEGARFKEDTKSLKRFKNVNLYERYLTPAEIAKEHKTHGIFLCTTRMDTQGVSRDEAMSSGLVPVTNNVAAVGEFTDETCAVLAGNEDYRGIARGILRLVRNPSLFLKMSENAAKRVRRQSSADIVLESEIELTGEK